MARWTRFILVGGIAFGLLSIYSGTAGAATPEEKCIKAKNKNAQKLVSSYGKGISLCAKGWGKGKAGFPSDTEACTLADAKGKIAKGEGKVDADDAPGGKCDGVVSVATSPAAEINAAALANGTAMIDVIFGGSRPVTKNSSKADQKCQDKVTKTTFKCQDEKLKVFNFCKKTALKAAGGVADIGDLETCMGPPQVDTKGKIGKKCGKILKDITKNCSGNLATLFPSCGESTDVDTAACLDVKMDCQVCLFINEIDNLSVDCDLFDDSLANGSCAPPAAAARLITDPNDLIGGLLARGRLGDYLMENDRVHLIIQALGRNFSAGVGQFGGQIIDADLQRGGAPGRDLFEEWSVLINLENTANYTSISVLNDGSNGLAAIVRVSGPDDLLDRINASSIIEDFGIPFPSQLDDTDQPVTITTDYILEPGENALRIESTITNTDPNGIELFLGDFMSSLAQEIFNPGYGFGEPLVTSADACPPDRCDFVAWAGEGEKGGVSYGYISTVDDTTTFNTNGVQVAVLGASVLGIVLGAQSENFIVAGSGSVTVTRYLVIGDGDVGAIVTERNRLRSVPSGTVEGFVRRDGIPVEGAEVVAIGPTADGPKNGLDFNVVSHFRTDATGYYGGTLPSADYDLRVNLDGHLFGDPNSAPITVVTGGALLQDFTLSVPGTLRVTIADSGAGPLAARVSVVGFDPTPDPGNHQELALGVIINDTGVFGRPKAPLPFGLARVIFVDDGGDSGDVALEPGDYTVVVSHGSEYSIHTEDITVTSGATNTVTATLGRVIDTTGFISGDFHVHSFDSVDSAITRNERIISMLAEGVDFFTPSDHEFRADFTADIAALGVSDLISVAVNNEITPFDYGHYGGFPMEIDPNQVNGGAIDWGREAPPGEDFPALGAFGLTPGEIFAEVAADPGEEMIAIHHVGSFFEGNLQIDTGVAPPASDPNGDYTRFRLDPAVTNFWDDGFTALELWIETSNGQDSSFLNRNAGHWFNLLNQGIVRTGTSSSDNHHLVVVQSGFPRSMIASPTDDPGAIGAIAETIAANVNDGRVIGTNGPFIRVTLEADPNEFGGLGLGESTIVKATGGSATVTVDIQSPEWAPFDTVELYVNSATDPIPQAEGPPEYRICPDFSKSAPGDFTISSVPVDGATRLAASVSFSISGLSGDAWVVAMVKGTPGTSCPLFPVVPNDLDPNVNLTIGDLRTCTSDDGGVTSLAFSNPIFLDVNNNGDYDEPGLLFQTCP